MSGIRGGVEKIYILFENLLKKIGGYSQILLFLSILTIKFHGKIKI